MDDRSGKFLLSGRIDGQDAVEEPEGWNLEKKKQDDVEDEVKEDTANAGQIGRARREARKRRNGR